MQKPRSERGFFWSRGSDLNRRPADYESADLPLSYSGSSSHESVRVYQAPVKQAPVKTASKRECVADGVLCFYNTVFNAMPSSKYGAFVPGTQKIVSLTINQSLAKLIAALASNSAANGRARSSSMSKPGWWWGLLRPVLASLLPT